jgi:hypothetical protein
MAMTMQAIMRTKKEERRRRRGHLSDPVRSAPTDSDPRELKKPNPDVECVRHQRQTWIKPLDSVSFSLLVSLFFLSTFCIHTWVDINN